MAQVQLEHATCLLIFLSLSLDATESFPWSRRSRPFGGCALFCGAMGLIDVDDEAQATFPTEPLHITGLH